ncbi:MAG: hypothetical protein II882_01035 [Lachnospiraceae bacterium]|nr:hypothetical protein [Lachnospiraceae bacterium]
MTRAEAYFDDAIRNGELSHAYLLESARPEEAQAAARRIVRRIACEKGTGCGNCASCRAFDSGNHPDIIVLRKEKDAPSVREVREQLLDDIGIRPYRFPRKIYLIDEAEKLNIQSQNAMLKTLEEPPAYAMIFLVTSNRNAFLPTVLSRVVSLKADEVRPEEAEEEAAADALFDYIRRAEFLTAAQMSGIAAEMKSRGMDPEIIITTLNGFVRDVLAVKSGAEEKLLYPAQRLTAFDWSARMSDRFLRELWEKLGTGRAALSSNGNPDLVIELVFLKIKEGLLSRDESD